MNKIIIEYFKTPFGELISGSCNEQLVLCDWRYRKMRTIIDNRIKKELEAGFEMGYSKVLDNTKTQLDEYFNGERKKFEIPIRFTGTSFQKMVWDELLSIPFGKTESYLSISKKLNNEKAIRAVASANGANAIAIIVPCHRVIGSDGRLTGYAGGLSTKKKLLQLEMKFFPLEQMQLFNDSL